MRKVLLMSLIFALILGFGGIKTVAAPDSETETEAKIEAETEQSQILNENVIEVKNAIEAYKSEDYLACISLLKEYTAKNAKNAIAWYYLGNAYMNIAMIPEANAAFDKVVSLNELPKLTSYSIQAKLCMQNSNDCKYENFSESEIKKLKENPAQFIANYYEMKRRGAIKTDDVIQIENLIDGIYPNNIHPQAQDFIRNERIKIKAAQINSGSN